MAEASRELVVRDAAAWRAWLGDHHGDEAGVRLVLAKKGVTDPTSITYDQALEEALCHGWIDGQVGRRDAATYFQRFTPRRRRSPWSQRNVGLVERLTAEGRMHPAGLAEVERARADGRWDAAYAGPASITVPTELTVALEANPAAAAAFAGLSSQNRFAVLYRVTTPRTAAGRERAVARMVDMLARGETLHPQRRTFTGKGLQPGVDLDSTGSLLELMDESAGR